MYESKYQKYITKNTARFAEKSELLMVCKQAYNENERACGIPLYYDNDKLYVDNEDNHTLVIGPTGSKKSRVTVFSTVASIIEAGESAVINDPKGEIYKRTAERARKVGANVILLNFRKPSKSFFWNPMIQAMRFYQRGMRDDAMQCINDFAQAIISPTQKRTVDTYWGDTSQIFLVAIMTMLMESVPQQYFNLKMLIPFCYEENDTVLKVILNYMNDTSTATFGLRSVVDLKADRTKSCIYGTLLTALRPFVQNEQLLNMICGNSIDIESIGQKQTIVYLIYPDEKASLNFLVNLFYTQAYETFVSLASMYENDRLPVRVNFVLDEFSNLTKVENFDNRISEARSKNIRYFIFAQSFGQLEQKYAECAETILSNCSNWICFSSKEMKFLDKLSNICGDEIDYNGNVKPLISASDMQYLKKKREGSEVLIIKQGQYPMVTELPDFDYIEISAMYPIGRIDAFCAMSDALSISPDDWLSKVRQGVFSCPK